jgi:hypothetical protein
VALLIGADSSAAWVQCAPHITGNASECSNTGPITGINMMLQPQSQLSYQLGRANAAGDATNSVTDVAGNLTLNAVTPSGERK